MIQAMSSTPRVYVCIALPTPATFILAHGSWLARPADSSVAINQQVKSNVQQQRQRQLPKPEPTVEILKFHHTCNSGSNRNQNHPQKMELISMFNKKFMKICQPARSAEGET